MNHRKLCNCFTEIDPDIEEWNEYTGHDEWSAVYTIQLGELIESGVFDWSRSMLDWSSAAYDSEQYERVCSYFEDRFRFREISIEPFEEWANYLRSRLVYELMPKYRIQYAEAAREWDIATGGKEWGNSTGTKNDTTRNVGISTDESSGNETRNTDNYYKGRDIGSDYPETLLSGNSDYITTGKDTEDERIIDDTLVKSGSVSKEDERTITGNGTLKNVFEKFKHLSTTDYVEAAQLYSDLFGTIDKRLLDECESLFIGMYTTNVNATW